MAEVVKYVLDSVENREYFFDTMKTSVVVISSEGSSEKNNSNTILDKKLGTGFFLQEGYILSSSFIVPEYTKTISFQTFEQSISGSYSSCDVVAVNKKQGWVLLKPQNLQMWKFAELRTRFDIQLGENIVTIGHPSNLTYSLLFGEVGYGTKKNAGRYVSDLINSEEIDLHQFDSKMPVIQINNIHGTFGLCGAPLFNLKSEIVGIMSFNLGLMDFAIPISHINESIKKHIKIDKEKQTKKDKANKNKNK